MGEGGQGAHDDAPLERDGHDTVHDEGDEDEVPGCVEAPGVHVDVQNSLKSTEGSER